MATVRDILTHKGTQVKTVPAGTSVLDATRQMNDFKIGAMVVLGSEHPNMTARMVGVFTERDVLRRVVAEGRAPETTTVAEVMTTEVVICAPDTAVEEVGRLMKDFRVRHLPVLGPDGTLLGLVSIGDINAYHVRDQEATIQTLEEYIHGRV